VNDINLNAPEIRALHRKTPYVIEGVSHGMFSVARHYGGASFNGSHYVYNPTNDTLVRDDVLKVAAKLKRKREASES
jgi:hypothetical protein